jgi:hypothetical protein
MLASTTGWTSVAHDHPIHHGHHALASSLSVDAATVVEHPHVQNSSVAATPDAFADAALPRSVALLAAIGLVAVVGAAFSSWATGAPAVIRGPPRRGAFPAGQQLLLRLCIARR